MVDSWLDVESSSLGGVKTPLMQSSIGYVVRIYLIVMLPFVNV